MSNTIRSRDSLECFLQLLIDDESQYQQLQQLLTNSKTNIRCKSNQLKRLLHLLPKFIRDVRKLDFENYDYTLDTEVFADCLTYFPLLNHDLLLLESVCKSPIKPKHNIIIEVEQMRETLSHFLHYLKQALTSSVITKQRSFRQKQCNRMCRSLYQYVDALFAEYIKIEVVRIDLEYLQDTVITLEQFESHLDLLYDHSRTYPLFANMVGHVLKLEYGLYKGFHAHALLFFNGHKHQNAWHLARKIGEHWRNQITQGLGIGWNIHDNEKQYEKLGISGIGTIHYQDLDKIQNLKTQVIDYLCCPKQFIKPKTKPKMKLIRRGDMPVLTNVKQGRKRMASDSTI